MMLKASGVIVPTERKSMVASRLHERLRETQTWNFTAYLALLKQTPAELHCFVDALTTHETYFFREKAHFDHMMCQVRERKLTNARIWSAACSMGHEAYTAALLMAEFAPEGRWQVTGTDIALDTLRKAKEATYSLVEKRKILNNLYQLYCHENNQDQTFTLKDSVTSRVQFQPFNLLSQRAYQKYDFVYLRNVLIYFSRADQEKIIANVLSALSPEGVIYFGHSEQALAREMGLERVGIGAYKRLEKSTAALGFLQQPQKSAGAAFLERLQAKGIN
jgi:chemotaxis protein methyltransferase CheR